MDASEIHPYGDKNHVQDKLECGYAFCLVAGAFMRFILHIYMYRYCRECLVNVVQNGLGAKPFPLTAVSLMDHTLVALCRSGVQPL